MAWNILKVFIPVDLPSLIPRMFLSAKTINVLFILPGFLNEYWQLFQFVVRRVNLINPDWIGLQIFNIHCEPK